MMKYPSATFQLNDRRRIGKTLFLLGSGKQEDSAQASEPYGCQVLCGPGRLFTIQTPFHIYEREGKVDFESGTFSLAEIIKDQQDNYFIKPTMTILLDSQTVSQQTKLWHGCKIIFPGKYSQKDGGHILVVIFSKTYILERGLNLASDANPKSIFIPKRRHMYDARIPMEQRIINDKWNFEEREHMK